MPQPTTLTMIWLGLHLSRTWHGARPERQERRPPSLGGGGEFLNMARGLQGGSATGLDCPGFDGDPLVVAHVPDRSDVMTGMIGQMLDAMGGFEHFVEASWLPGRLR
jgi:hypothetical protein